MLPDQYRNDLIIELVDCISRDGTDTPVNIRYDIVKRPDKFWRFLTYIQSCQVHKRTLSVYMAEPPKSTLTSHHNLDMNQLPFQSSHVHGTISFVCLRSSFMTRVPMVLHFLILCAYTKVLPLVKLMHLMFCWYIAALRET